MLVGQDVLLQIIERYSDGILILNKNREIIFFNEVLLKMTGLSTGEFIQEGPALIDTLPLESSEESEHPFTLKTNSNRQVVLSMSSHHFYENEFEYVLIRFVPGNETRPIDNESTDFYDEIFDHMEEAVYSADKKGRIIKANNAFFETLGYDKVTMPENIDYLHVYLDDYEEKLGQMLGEDIIKNFKVELYDVSGEPCEFSETIWVHRDSKGGMKGYTSHLRNMSKIRSLKAQLKVSELNYNRLFELITASIIIVDEAGHIVNLNNAAEKLYGYSRHEARGRYFDDVFKRDDQNKRITDIIRITLHNNGKYVEMGVPRVHKDGRQVFTYCTYFMVTGDDEGPIRALFILEKDLTERIGLESELKRSLSKIQETQSAAIIGFAKLTEFRDKITGKHHERIQEYTRKLATALQKKTKYSDYIDDKYINDLTLSAVLHDIGKVGIEDSVLLKSGKLTPVEFTRMKEHSRLGGDALSAIDKALHHESFLTIGKEIAYYHHECWDGTGYPLGLAGERIPLSARIIAIADVYDALTSRRTYKEAYPHERALQMIKIERGKHFDPDIVDVFLENEAAFRQIRNSAESSSL